MPLHQRPVFPLVQRGNTIEYLGVPAIYDGQPNQFIFPDLMIRLRVKSDTCTKFLYFALLWEGTRNYLRDRAIGTAGNMPTINQETLIGTPINCPSPQEQYEIVRRVEGLFKSADTVEKRVLLATVHAEKLTQAILAKAFRGELVRTEAVLAGREGRSYETVSALLARINADHKAKEDSGKPKAKSSTSSLLKNPSFLKKLT